MLVQRVFKTSNRPINGEPERPVVGILAFEVSRMMSKVINIWNSIKNKKIAGLREEIANSVGIHKLVSDDDDYLMDLALAEITENLLTVGRSVSVLGKKCAEGIYHNLETIFDDPSFVDPKWYGWEYKIKKMERKVKKMEKFVAASEQLHSELEQKMRDGEKQKVLWQLQEVKRLQEMSPWGRTYDYIVRLLLRSLFTILERMKYASVLVQTSSNLALKADKNIRFKDKRCYVCEKHQMKGGIFACVGLTGGGSVSPAVETIYGSSEGEDTSTMPITDSPFFHSKRGLLKAPPSTLGYAGLHLHYANLIILIEKVASSPHLIGLDERDDLYHMLPSNMRRYLRSKLKTFSRMSCSCDGLAAEWSSVIARILEWLCPLARNTIQWQSERSFERLRTIRGSSILLVQTLYFAKQEDTEAAIIELLMGLSYLFHFGKDINEKSISLRESSSRTTMLY